MITFLLSGFWHGANWTYLVWGGLNGVFLVIENFLRSVNVPVPTTKVLRGLQAVAQTLFTFMLMCFAWVYFRADSFGEANMIVGKMLTDWYTVGEQFVSSNFLSSQVFLGQSPYNFYWCLATVGILLVAEYLQEKDLLPKIFSPSRPILTALLAWFVVATALLLIIVFFRSDSAQFIYFQF